jgi:hypothetical protein
VDPDSESGSMDKKNEEKKNAKNFLKFVFKIFDPYVLRDEGPIRRLQSNNKLQLYIGDVLSSLVN